jgi:hypothetical protein
MIRDELRKKWNHDIAFYDETNRNVNNKAEERHVSYSFQSEKH